MDEARWLAAHVSGPQHRFKVIKLRGEGMVYTLGFQRLKERAFSSSLKTSHQTKCGTGGTASGEHLELVSRTVLPPLQTRNS